MPSRVCSLAGRGICTNFRDYRRYMQGQNKRAAQESFAELETILADTFRDGGSYQNSLEEMDGNYVHARAIKEGLQTRCS